MSLATGEVTSPSVGVRERIRRTYHPVSGGLLPYTRAALILRQLDRRHELPGALDGTGLDANGKEAKGVVVCLAGSVRSAACMLLKGRRRPKD